MATFFTSDLHLGHIHNSTTTDAYGYIKEHLPCTLNAGVDINNYEPVTFEELLENNNRWYERGGTCDEEGDANYEQR